MLVLICVIVAICVGAPFGRPQETAELDKNIDKNEEEIFAYDDVATTSIGTNVNATFNGTTGEVHISSTAGNIGTISKSKLYSFLEKCGKESGQILGIKTITIDNEVKLPKDSSNLFSSYENGIYMKKLSSINNAGNIDTSDVTKMSYMFEDCYELTMLDLRDWNVSKVEFMTGMFKSCYKLENINVTGWDLSSVKSVYTMFANCEALSSIDLSSWVLSHGGGDVNGGDFADMFAGAVNLEEIRLPKVIPQEGLYGPGEWSVFGVSVNRYPFFCCK